MIFEWDESKNKSNISKHGIDFNEITNAFNDSMVIQEDRRHDYGEERLIGIGKIMSFEIVIVWTKRADKIRIISARQANNKERKIYNDTINEN